ncbi:cytochrome P450 [Trametes meyenii]|nr:cytochrome P450 [Trametes meyenii]
MNSTILYQELHSRGHHSLTLPSIGIVLAVISAVFSPLFWCHAIRPLSRIIPPGPLGLAFLGKQSRSFLSLATYPELSLDRWAKKFGPILTFTIGRQLFLVLSDSHVMKDILITNGAIFSSRKDFFMKVQTILQYRGITATPYNEHWRKHRRIVTKLLTARAVATYAETLQLEAKEMIHDLMRDGNSGALPIDPSPYASRVSLNVIFGLVYGQRTKSITDPAATEILRMSREFMNTTGPVSNLVDFFPILQKLPNTMARRGRKLNQDILAFNRPYVADIEARLKRGEDVPDCLAKTLLLTREAEGLDDLDIIILCAAMLIGGVETTASVQQWFAAHIARCPGIQAEAQAELDRVCGRDRLPSVDDERDLPYVRAIAKEVERFHNPFWLGTPHYSTEDFSYRGYYIPKGTVVIANTWTIHHDSQRYPDPYVFKPERYLDDTLSSAESARLPDPTQRDHWAFGAGRRLCPGSILADRQIFLGLSHMLWAFRIEPVPEEPIDLKEYDGASGRSPVSFRVRLIPRDANVAQAVGLR